MKSFLQYKIPFLNLQLFFFLTVVLLHENSAIGYNQSNFILYEKGDSISLVNLLEHKNAKTEQKIFMSFSNIENVWVSDDVKYLDGQNLAEAMKQLLGLRLVKIRGHYILLEKQVHKENSTITSKGVIEIGSSRNMGRYRQAKLTGVVKDASSGETLPGAIVYSVNQGHGVTTDVNGMYEIVLPVGEHSMQISFLGFAENLIEVLIFESGELDFELFLDSYSLQEVVVQSNRLESNLSRTQMNMVRISAKELNKLPGSYGERDIVRSISLLPGVQSVGEFGTGFNVRGGSSDQNLVLLENVPVFNTSNLFGLMSVVNPDIVDNAVLLKGGLPARYGERASSVMDIRLSKGREKKTIYGHGGLGVLNSRLTLGANMFENKLNLVIGGRASYFNWLLDRIPDLELMNSEASFSDLAGLVNIRLNDRNNLTLFGFFNHNNANLDGDTRYDYSNTLGNLRWDSNLSSAIYSSFNLGLSNYHYSVEEYVESSLIRNRILNSDILYKTAKWDLTYDLAPGIDFNFGSHVIAYDIQPGELLPGNSSSEVKPDALQKESGNELALYLSSKIEINPRLTMEGGVRTTNYLLTGPSKRYRYQTFSDITSSGLIDSVSYGKNDVIFSHVSFEPRFSLRFAIDTVSSFKASYNRGFQYLNLISNSAVMNPSDYWKLSNELLPPVEANHFAIGYFRNLSNNSVEMSLEVYYKSLANILQFAQSSQLVMNPRIEEDVSLSEGYSIGAEFFLKKNSGNLTGWLSYTLSGTQLRTSSQVLEKQINNNNYFPADFNRPHNLSINANLTLSRRWSVGAIFSFASGRPLTLPEQIYTWGGDYIIAYSERNKYRFPNYHRLDLSINLSETLRVNQRFKGSWSLSIINVYGKKNPYSVFYEKEPFEIESGTRSFNLYQLYVLGKPLPTITYNFSF